MAVRRFVLQRNEDVSGVSGVGVVAEGVEFSDGSVAIRWISGDHHSTVLWDDLHSVEVIHGHDGRTLVQFLDEDMGEGASEYLSNLLARAKEHGQERS